MSRRFKRVEAVLVLLVQYSPGQRRKKKAIQARSGITLPLGGLPWEIYSMQWRMKTGRGRNLPGRGVFFCVGCKLSSQAKINGAHGVESWVWGPHSRKDLSHGAYVFIHTYFVDRLVFGRKDACAYILSKYV